MANPLKRWTLKSGAMENLRDLGGYACEGGVTRYGAILRSDQVYSLTENDKEFLLKKGLTDIIDLRDAEECQAFPNSFLSHKTVKLNSMQSPPIMDCIHITKPEGICMGDDYVERIEKLGDYFAKVIEAVSTVSGLTIIHCMAGKDRTGITCALILLILGVDERDVIADYQLSATFLKDRIEQYRIQYPDLPQYLSNSDPKNMEMLIDHLNKKYGGPLPYLKSKGLTDDAVTGIRTLLVAKE